MNKRQQQYRDTRKKIWETGRNLIAEKGYDKVSIKDITSASGVSKGNFYHYFKSKDAFMIDLERSPYIKLMEEVISLENSSLQTKFKYYITKRFNLLNSNNLNFTRQWLHHISTSSYYESYGNDNKIDYDLLVIGKLINDAIQDGELKKETPVETLSRTIIFTLFGTTLYYCVSDGKFDLDKWGEDLSNFISDNILIPYIIK